jgi:hypothetical protein
VTRIWERKTRNFRVTLSWEYESDPDLSWDETGETQAKINSGEWACYVFKVAVYDAQGEVACDYLGGSIYADPADFAKERGGYFSDMVAEAIAEARKVYHQPRAFLRAPKGN